MSTVLTLASNIFEILIQFRFEFHYFNFCPVCFICRNLPVARLLTQRTALQTPVRMYLTLWLHVTSADDSSLFHPVLDLIYAGNVKVRVQ